MVEGESKFEGNAGRKRQELEGGDRGVKGGLQIRQRLLRGALRGLSPLGLEGGSFHWHPWGGSPKIESASHASR